MRRTPHGRPGIAGESGLDGLPALGVDDQQDFLSVVEWATQDNEAIVDEATGVLLPVLSPFLRDCVINHRL